MTKSTAPKILTGTKREWARPDPDQKAGAKAWVVVRPDGWLKLFLTEGEAAEAIENHPTWLASEADPIDIQAYEHHAVALGVAEA